jgi:hypothetical protein
LGSSVVVALSALVIFQRSILAGSGGVTASEGTFPHTGAIPFCGIDTFAWTVGNALARSAQPPPTAWRCLRQAGFTTVVQQNTDGPRDAERVLVQAVGMSWIGDHAIADQTAYSPTALSAILEDVVGRVRAGERILVHDAGGRGRLGFWETAFLLWDGWTSEDALARYVQLGWKVNGVSDFGAGYECPDTALNHDPTAAKGSNGQFQAIHALIESVGQPPSDPSPDLYGNRWQQCGWPAYMQGWDYSAVAWPEGGGAGWSMTGVIAR